MKNKNTVWGVVFWNNILAVFSTKKQAREYKKLVEWKEYRGVFMVKKIALKIL